MTTVTIASYDDSPPLGGQGVTVSGMRRALEVKGVRTHTISGRGDHALRYPRITGRAPLDLSLHLNLHPDLLLRPRSDVIHAHGGPGGVLLLRHLAAPVVYTAHHTYTQAHPRRSLHRLPAPLEARSYRLAAMVLAVSSTTADSVRAMGVPSSRIQLVPPGVDVPDIDVSREPGRVLFLGRLEPHKGVLDALDVIADLLETLPEARGVIVGSGSLLPEVRARSRHHPRIEVKGAMDARAAQLEYARASIVLMPSRYEGLGLVALEAQAAATPVVGYAVSGLVDAVQVGGILVAPGRIDELRRAALRLLREDAVRGELGERGREFVRQRYSWGRVADTLLQVYGRVANG